MTSQFMDPVLSIAYKIWGQYFTGARIRPSFELEKKMPFYGDKRHCPWA